MSLKVIFCEGCSVGFLSPCLFPVGLPFVYPRVYLWLPSDLFFLFNILLFTDKKKIDNFKKNMIKSLESKNKIHIMRKKKGR